MKWVLVVSRVLFNILTFLCILFDVLLFLGVIKNRFFTKSTRKSSFVYISFMIISGVIGKCANLLMVDAWPVADLIDPLDGYDVYRKLFGKQVTLIATFCYLSEIFINWLMTCHRVSILLSPARAPHWFTDSKMFTYCSGITVFLIIYLLIPYYSPCFVNFNAESSLHETACAPKKHPLTQFQNLYLIWVPVSAVLINSSMIFYIKFARKFFKKPSVLSNATIKRENSMIRQACFIATYLSIFEIGYLFMRLFPAEFGSLPQEIQSVTYQIRLFANCSLNFFVYFVETKSTRTLVLNYVGFRKKITLVTPTTVSSNQAKKL